MMAWLADKGTNKKEMFAKQIGVFDKLINWTLYKNVILQNCVSGIVWLHVHRL